MQIFQAESSFTAEIFSGSMKMMLKKLYRKLFPLKNLIRNASKEVRNLINTQTTTLSSSIEHKLDAINNHLLAKLDGNSNTVITSTQLVAADINASLMPIRLEMNKQYELMQEVNKNLYILQNELRDAQSNINRIDSMLESVSGIKGATAEIRVAVNKDLKEAAIHLKSHVEEIENGVATSNALAEYLLARHTPQLAFIETFKAYAALRKGSSHSQLKQDLWVLWESDEKKNGYFVELGATDGDELSNTYLLEKQYGWTGILCEPQPFWQERLKKNRAAKIDSRAVWNKSGETLLFAVPERKELGGILETGKSDMHATERMAAEQIQVQTVSLLDLLQYHNAPQEIDFLSIDTEGSEYEILSAFDLKAYRISLICVEHNYNKEQRQKIHDLLAANGYERQYENVSEFDDWYSLKS